MKEIKNLCGKCCGIFKPIAVGNLRNFVGFFRCDNCGDAPEEINTLAEEESRRIKKLRGNK